ncbi:unnamed protein product, partial [Mesorhabditis belari]|uniref:Uncharacterized protein n=1 Tax=Mesorhabditis belari TaxID=2138241 RepID=A0AAF3EU11_9BILA
MDLVKYEDWTGTCVTVTGTASVSDLNSWFLNKANKTTTGVSIKLSVVGVQVTSTTRRTGATTRTATRTATTATATTTRTRTTTATTTITTATTTTTTTAATTSTATRMKIVELGLGNQLNPINSTTPIISTMKSNAPIVQTDTTKSGVKKFWPIKGQNGGDNGDNHENNGGNGYGYDVPNNGGSGYGYGIPNGGESGVIIRFSDTFGTSLALRFAN